MSANGSYRRHSPQLGLQLCHNIHDGRIGRREAQRTYRTSASLIQMWLNQLGRGEFDSGEVAASTITEYEVKIAALERRMEQLTMGVDLLKKTSRLLLISNNEDPSIVSGPFVVPPTRGTT